MRRYQVAWWLPMLLLGVVTAALAYVTGIAATRRLGSRLASFVALTEVLAAVLWAWVLLGELPRSVQLLGGVLILAGVVRERSAEASGRSGTRYRASCRLMNTSRTISSIPAAVGIASSAPTTPSRAVPTSAAITVTAPGMSTDRDITCG